jgi:hypothetical protein
MRRGNAVTVRGTDYTSIKEAWLSESPEGLKYATVSLRIQRGWDQVRAVLVRPDWNSHYRRGITTCPRKV